MIDYHIHTARCGHATGAMADYVAQAKLIGLKEIGFADHLPLLKGWDETLTMPESELSGYIAEIKEQQSANPEISIKTGIEADFIPGLEAETARLLASQAFDYVIGSVHFINGWGFDDSRYLEGYQKREIYDIYKDYFELVKAAARSGLFDIIGHLDLVKKYNFRPQTDFTALLEDAVQAIASAGVCVEINTAGLRKPVGEIYPSKEILAMCYKAGVPMVLGSDAHEPNQVGMDFGLAVATAQEIGYKEVAVFRNRERQFIKL